MTHDILDHIRRLKRLMDAEIPFVVVTLVAVRGSAPQIVGAKAIVTLDGIETGTVGGGKIEAAAIRHAQQLLENDKPVDEHGHDPGARLATWNLQTDIGMTCGGEVQLFFEVHTAVSWPIVVFGAGHVAQALIPMLMNLNCQVTCIDSRPNWLGKLPEHPKLKIRCLENPSDAVRQQPSNAFFVLMSRGHSTDLPVLAEILATRNARYVGVIGSQQKASVLRRNLSERGIAPHKIESFVCPIGLPIGNNTPPEIAISVVAQLIQQRDELANGIEP